MLTNVSGAKDGDDCERHIIGQVHATNTQYLFAAQNRSNGTIGCDECELENATSGGEARVSHLRLDRAETTHLLANGSARDKPSEALPSIEHTSVSQDLKSPTQRDPTDRIGHREFRLTRKQTAGRKFTTGHAFL